MKFRKSISLICFLLLTQCISVSCLKNEESSSAAKESKPKKLDEHHFKQLLADTSFTFFDGFIEILINGQFQEKMNAYFSNPNEQNNQDQDSSIDEFREDFPKVLDLVFSNRETVNTNNFLYKPNLEVCNQYLAQNNPISCRESMEHISLEVERLGSLKGNIEFKFDNAVVLLAEYNEQEINFSLNLESVETVLASINQIIQKNEPGQGMGAIPDMSGKLNISFSNINNESILGRIDILQDITFDLEVDNGNVNLMIDHAQSFATLEINKASKKLKISFDMMAIEANFPTAHHEDGDTEDTWLKTTLTFDGIYGVIELNDNDKKLTVSDFGLKNNKEAKLYFSDILAAKLNLSEISTELDASGDYLNLNFNQALNGALELTESPANNPITNLVLDISADASIKFEEIWSNNNQNSMTILELLAGELSLAGDQEMNVSVDLNAPDCFEFGNNGEFILVQAQCD